MLRGVRHLAVVAGTLSVALALGGLAPAAQAHPVSHAEARIVNVEPVPGGVVAAGTVTVSGRVVADVTVDRAEVRSGGTTVAATLSGSDPTHRQAAATLALPPGHHMVELEAVLAGGQRVLRRWRVSVSGLGVQRLAGDDRIGTAVAVSQARHPERGSAALAFLARSDDYPDSLAAAPVATAGNAALLLTNPATLSAAAAAELERVLAPGGVVYLLGGTAALDPVVEQAVAALGFEAQRLTGPDRFATAASLADHAPDPDTVFIASGRGFADALAAAVPAGAGGHPILLTEPGGLPPGVAEVLQRLAPAQAYVVGGPGAVSDAVVAAVADLAGSVERLHGPDRYATAEAVAAAFYPEAGTVAVASGDAFPDALTGGPYAAALGAPLLPLPGGGLRAPQRERIERDRPERALVFGGSAAVPGASVRALHAAWTGSGGPHVSRIRPAAGAEVTTLGEITIEADRPVERVHSPVTVTVNGNEALGSVSQRDERTLVFTVRELPRPRPAGVAHEVRVVGALHADGALRHFDHRFRLREFATFRPGDAGDGVRDLQRRLRDRGYWPGPIDGSYDTLVRHAVLAFQKAAGLPADGIFGPRTAEAFAAGRDRPAPRSREGRVVEVDLRRQLVMVVVNGRVQWIFHTSTGHGQWYEFEGRRYRATTTTGRMRITREIDGWRHAARGALWRPKYFDDSRGIAIHGYTSVPDYPASSGCVRVSNPAMNFIWDAGLAPVGTAVWVYPENHYG
jgi:putative cell wall-binding protein